MNPWKLRNPAGFSEKRLHWKREKGGVHAAPAVCTARIQVCNWQDTPYPPAGGLPSRQGKHREPVDVSPDQRLLDFLN